ncbi:matrixin family metalloprotease [Arthrobacter ginkgonis]
MPAVRRCSGTIRTSLAGAAFGCALLLTACTPSDQGNPSGGPTRGSPGTGVPSPVQTPGACVAAAGATVQDIDPEDSPVPPWNKPAGQELMVEFSTSQLSARYAGFVSEAAAIWSESPCLNAVAVQACSTGSNCVLLQEDASRSRNTDGEMEWEDSGDYMESATITLFTRPLDRATDNGALATIVHEMGHALGLDHRLARTDVMNSVTDNTTNPTPDAVNFSNLVAIYGS